MTAAAESVIAETAESTGATTSSTIVLSIATESAALLSLLPEQEAKVAATATTAKAKNFFIFVL